MSTSRKCSAQIALVTMALSVRSFQLRQGKLEVPKYSYDFISYEMIMQKKKKTQSILFKDLNVTYYTPFSQVDTVL